MSADESSPTSEGDEKSEYLRLLKYIEQSLRYIAAFMGMIAVAAVVVMCVLLFKA